MVIVQSIIDVIMARDDTLLTVYLSNFTLFLEDIIMVSFWAAAVDQSSKFLMIPIVCTVVMTSIVGRILHIVNKWKLYEYERQ